VSKIHQVKGKEYQAVCVYVPADLKGMQPAEAIIAAANAVTGEILSARRVWYVGGTRAQDFLAFAIPQAWIPALEASEHGRAFLAAFDQRINL
jgi:hypothetical protein